ncbi:hypothetical protein EZ449_09370 [Pedobacter frigidisoli]|uniref:Uncharacterized protein n=1 Tax=Pedobacter frigidisoli TaxID=2530455 RepID=A0A4R0P1B8_9SPHI|nr:hypothetical protein [Pedobacter frigidisoli]TCD10544.1 hypothetical protein EZ449_09370 [Pedobacter frigidisoli]
MAALESKPLFINPIAVEAAAFSAALITESGTEKSKRLQNAHFQRKQTVSIAFYSLKADLSIYYESIANTKTSEIEKDFNNVLSLANYLKSIDN